MTGVPTLSEQITVSTTALSLPQAVTFVPTRRYGAIVEVRTNGIYYTLHDATVTPNSGDHNGAPGTIFEAGIPSKVRMIRSGASDAVVKVTYFTQTSENY